MKSLKLGRQNILGVPVDVVARKEAMDWILKQVQNDEAFVQDDRAKDGQRSLKHIVTAYSEFFVQAQKDAEFMRVLKGADLVVPDGVSVLGALRYREKILQLPSSAQDDKADSKILSALSSSKLLSPSTSLRINLRRMFSLFLGLQVGWEIITGKVGETVTGVWLVEEILRLAPEKGWKVFLLGGYGETADNLKSKILKQVQDDALMVQNDEFIMADAGVGDVEKARKEEHLKVVGRINEFKPDILLVAYGPVKQEKWIAKYKNKLKVKAVIGVGGTFDELTGSVSKVPLIIERYGLKWLWRVLIQPSRIGRIWSAVVVFPWLVWKGSLEDFRG